MTAQRDGKERIYDFLENVAPSNLQHTSTPAQAEEFFARKAISQLGLATARSFRNRWSGLIERRVDAKEANAKLAQMMEAGQLAAVDVEGEKDRHFYLAGDLSILEEVNAGRVPRPWEHASNAKQSEVRFLSPLDYVSARGRAGKLFDFEYIWEIYKPAAKRRYGPYTLPILYGDRLVGRMDAKLERQQKELRVNGIWLEEGFGVDEEFVAALANGLESFMQFLRAARLDLGAVESKVLRAQLSSYLDEGVHGPKSG